MKQRSGLYIVILLLVSIAFLAGGCGKKADETEAAEEKTAAFKESESVEAEAEEQSIEVSSGEESEDTKETEVPLIGIITSEGGVEDASFNQGAWEGLQQVAGMYDCETLFLESSKEKSFGDNLQNLLDKGGDLCWGIGFDCASELFEAAKNNPGADFAVIDYSSEDVPDNVTCVQFRVEEPSFLAGYIAGSMTETGKVGFIGGVQDEIIDQFRYGYTAGVDYAAAQKNKDITVDAKYAGSYSQPGAGHGLAITMFESGCDIIFQAAGETGLGVIEAAKETDSLVIGVDKDQAYLAPENVLTSVIKNINMAVFDISGEYLSGGSIGGKTISLGIAENAAGISDNHDLYSESLYEEVLSLSEKITSGEL